MGAWSLQRQNEHVTDEPPRQLKAGHIALDSRQHMGIRTDVYADNGIGLND
jgi:hypothetical protein